MTQCLARARVLIVSDSAAEAVMVAMTLEFHGARTSTVLSGSDALASIAMNPPTIIVSLLSSEAGGYAWLRDLRSKTREEGGATPAVAVSDWSAESEYDGAAAAGFQAHLPRPLSLEMLVEVSASLARVIDFGRAMAHGRGEGASSGSN